MPNRRLTPEEMREVVRTCDRFEAAWKGRQQPNVEAFLSDVPGPLRAAVLRQLVLLDWDYRQRQGQAPSPRDYLDRFPGDQDLIASIAREMSEAPVSTRVGSDGLQAPETPWSCGTAATAAGQGTEPWPDRYEVLQEVGRGGIGVVVRCRDRHLGRDMAIKVLRPEYRDNAEARRRFTTEAQIGSRLQHPGIVPVYDQGWFANGQPYFTMKLVDGQSLATLLQSRASTADDQPRLLGVFEHVCQAVAYAHSRGVVHRDLKPANVMVGSFGEVQVMDWGFAKQLTSVAPPPGKAAGPGGNVIHRFTQDDDTQAGALMGTPAYMPPEQAQGRVAEIDPRADVFALGAMLCEIVTGRPPYLGRGPDDVCAQAAAGDLAGAVERVDRSGAADSLRALIASCLKVRRDDRPAHAGVIAEAVAAHRAAVQERLHQVQLKHAVERRSRRLAVAAAAALLIGASVAGWEAVAATRAKHDAEAATLAESKAKETAQNKEKEAKDVLEFFQKRVLAAPRPKADEGGLGKDVTVREALDRAEPEIARAFAGRPAVEASIRHWLGQSYGQLGLLNLALPQQERAVALNRQALGVEHEYTLGSMNNLAITLQQLGRGDEARALFQDVVDLKRRVLGPEDTGTLRSISNLAILDWDQGRPEDARKLFEEVLPVQKRVLGLENLDTLRSMMNLAMALRALGRRQEAREQLEEMLGIQRRVFPREHPMTFTAMGHLATLLDDDGSFDEAHALHAEVLDLQRKALPAGHPFTMVTMYNLACNLNRRHQYAEAQALFEDTLRLNRSAYPPGHRETLRTITEFAWMLVAAPDRTPGAPQRALALAKELVEHAPRKGNSWTVLGAARYRLGAWADAIEAFEKSESIAPGKYAATNAFFLAMAHGRRGARAEARRWYDQGAKLMDANTPDDRDLPGIRAEADRQLGITTR